MEPTVPNRSLTNPWLISGAIVLAAVLAFAFILIAGLLHNPVPRDLRHAVSFPVYYPVTSGLPKGYVLNESSFKQASPGVIIYSIGRAGGQRLILSEEKQPGGNTINDFVKSYLPLNSSFDTKLGKAQMGAFGNPPNLRNIVSLPIKNGPWLIITAPADTQQSDIKQIIQSLRK